MTCRSRLLARCSEPGSSAATEQKVYVKNAVACVKTQPMGGAKNARRRRSPVLPDQPVMGDRLRFARESADLSLEGVGEALGISGSAVSQWETGRTYPSRKSLLQFAELTGFGAMWLEFGCWRRPGARQKTLVVQQHGAADHAKPSGRCERYSQHF